MSMEGYLHRYVGLMWYVPKPIEDMPNTNTPLVDTASKATMVHEARRYQHRQSVSPAPDMDQ